MWESIRETGRCSMQEGAGWAIQVFIRHIGANISPGLGVYGNRGIRPCTREADRLKKRYFVLGFLTVFFLTASASFLFLIPQENQGPGNLPVEKVEENNPYTDEAAGQLETVYVAYVDEMDRFLDAFMDLTYNCNYEERHYYDGAEAFMTEECYSYYVPMTDPEDTADTFSPYASYLHGTDYYYRFITGNQVLCLARVRYSSSHNQSDMQESILSLSLNRIRGGWRIASIEILEI